MTTREPSRTATTTCWEKSGTCSLPLHPGFARQQECCCETLRAIDGVNYNAAMNTASINANTTAQTQKILDAISGNRMADMQNQINQLQLQAALCGIPRTTPYRLRYRAAVCRVQQQHLKAHWPGVTAGPCSAHLLLGGYLYELQIFDLRCDADPQTPLR